MNKVFLSLGSNIGSRLDNLTKAVGMIEGLENTVIDLESSIYETAPLYNCDQNHFFNKVVQIKTSLNPYKLLKEMKSIEVSMGRNIKNSHNKPRIIDIDILAFHSVNIESDDLVLPHPRILERRFVLEPWNEITPEYILYGQDLSIKELHNRYLVNNLKKQKVNIIKN